MLIVGGSLVGLTFALACAQRGIRTCIIDQAVAYDRHGAALGIDCALLLRTLGLLSNDGSHEMGFPTVTEYRQAVSWKALHGWLRALAERRSQITFMDGLRVVEVTQSDSFASVITVCGRRIDAGVIVGADGYRSVVRRAISPERSEPLYAGYMLWRALVSESSLSAGTGQSPTNEGVALANGDCYRLVAYPVAGENGSLVPGKRLISFTWYDKTQETLLRKAYCISSDGHVLSSLPAQNVPLQVRSELKDLAARIWPEPWKSVIVHALERGKVFGTPVAEYWPERLHRRRLAIIGDAAHVVSPATGMGFVVGIQDAEALADSLGTSFGRPADFPCAVEHYGHERLPAAQQLVAQSIDWSRAYLCGENVRLVQWRKFLKNKT